MTRLKSSPRPTTCFGSAAAAARLWSALKFGIPPLPPRLTHALPMSTAPAHVQRRQRMRVIGWSMGATASLLLVAWFGVPAIAARLTPLLPVTFERMLGDAVNVQVRGMLDTRKAGAAFDCGTAAAEIPGGSRSINWSGGSKPPPLSPCTCAPMWCAEAKPMPWLCRADRFMYFSGLIAKADNADEVAGVIAHEIGHVAHRDGTKAVLEGGGLSFLFGMLLGDFVGGGAVVLAAKTVLQSSYRARRKRQRMPMAPSS